MSETNEIKAAAAILGRLGGSRRTEAKARAARENGRRGGRPSRGAQIEQAARKAVEVWREPVAADPAAVAEHARRLAEAMNRLAALLDG